MNIFEIFAKRNQNERPNSCTDAKNTPQNNINVKTGQNFASFNRMDNTFSGQSGDHVAYFMGEFVFNSIVQPSQMNGFCSFPVYKCN